MALLARPAAAQSLQVLHSFAALSGPLLTNFDGANPVGYLVLSGKTLYGTASRGGAFGAGTVFAVRADGTGFTNLHRFAAVSGPLSTNVEGASPLAGLVLSGDTLYGTTSSGGTGGAGTVFSVRIDGTGFTNLHNFPALSGILFANSDGAHPQAPLFFSAGTLYGTARDGGAFGNGSLFALRADGTGFINLHSFSPAYYNPTGYYTNLDGANPLGGLILSNALLYGTAVYGGRAGQGTVFAVPTNGDGFVTLHHFNLVARTPAGAYTNSDGANPAATLSLAGNLLYGTAQGGGSAGVGTVFVLGSDGSGFRPLHSFNTVIEGAAPVAPLALAGQSICGTSSYGGDFAAGTLFQLGTDGSRMTRLFSFGSLSTSTNNPGGHPVAGVVVWGNALYGDAYDGGAGGAGSIFVFSLGPPQLVAERSGPNIVLSWPAEATGFKLQFTTDLSSPASWTNLSSAPVPDNGQNRVTNVISGSRGWFRLSSQ